MVSAADEVFYAIKKFGSKGNNLFEIAQIAQKETSGALLGDYAFRDYCGRVYSEQFGPIDALMHQVPLYVKIKNKGGKEHFKLTNRGKKRASRVEEYLNNQTL